MLWKLSVLSEEDEMKGIPSESEFRKALEERHGREAQDRLSAAHVAICGLGGLGSNIAVSLARIGVGHLHLIDFDCVDISNLNRQQYFADQIGLPKPQALHANLKRIAPYCDIRESFVRITPDNACELLQNEPFIAEAFDRPDQKAMLTRMVLEQMPDRFLAGASGMAGYGNSNTIQTRRITSHFFLCGDRVSDSEKGIGLMAPRVMLCVAHQANMLTELIIRQREENRNGTGRRI